jgi:hypothetical protein
MHTQVQERTTTHTTPPEKTDKHTWIEEVEGTGDHLVERIHGLVQESNTHWVTVRA